MSGEGLRMTDEWWLMSEEHQAATMDDGCDAEAYPTSQWLFYEERKKVQERYKEYDGMYLGHYVQYFFLTFFILGLVIFGLGIFLMLNSHYHWMK